MRLAIEDSWNSSSYSVVQVPLLEAYLEGKLLDQFKLVNMFCEMRVPDLRGVH